LPCNVYVKIDTGITYFYFEDILCSNRNKCLRGRTLYKITRPLSLDEVLKNITKNDKTDISKAKILILQEDVQTAGGHPGGEA